MGTHPAIVVATDNRLTTINIGFLTSVATTLGWATAIGRAGGALIDLGDWVVLALTAQGGLRGSLRGIWEPSGLQ